MPLLEHQFWYAARVPCTPGMQLPYCSVCFLPTYLYFLHSLINLFSLTILCCVCSTDHARGGYVTAMDLLHSIGDLSHCASDSGSLDREVKKVTPLASCTVCQSTEGSVHSRLVSGGVQLFQLSFLHKVMVSIITYGTQSERFYGVGDIKVCRGRQSRGVRVFSRHELLCTCTAMTLEYSVDTSSCVPALQ